MGKKLSTIYVNAIVALFKVIKLVERNPKQWSHGWRKAYIRTFPLSIFVWFAFIIVVFIITIAAVIFLMAGNLVLAILSMPISGVKMVIHHLEQVKVGED